jgi:hypothetical protein
MAVHAAHSYVWEIPKKLAWKYAVKRQMGRPICKWMNSTKIGTEKNQSEVYMTIKEHKRWCEQMYCFSG